MFCMLLAIREDTTFNTSKLPNPYLVNLFAHVCDGVGIVSRNGPGGPTV